MEPPIFYAPPQSIGDSTVVLSAEESKHACLVLRLKPGSIVILVDGLGSAWRGELASCDSKKTTVHLHQQLRNVGEPGVRLTLAVGISRASKLDSIIQKGTELGVIRFVPIVSEKSKVRLDDPRRAASRVKRLERVALAAMKQCRRCYRPEIASPVALTDFLAGSDPDSMRIVFHPGGLPLSEVPIDDTIRRITAMTGPEAGFSADEIDLARAAGYHVVGLGSRILRAENAAPVVCALIMDRLGEFR